MRFSPESPLHPIVPPELRCVWMTAGILSYQLCDRSFDCDSCPLDAAMRMHFSRKDERPPSAAMGNEEHTRYSRNHCWVARRNASAVRIGIEPTLASLLSPKEIVMPFVGDVVALDQYCCWIITEGGTLHISSPVSGTVIAVNSSVASDPFALANSPFVHGWLFDVRMRSDLAVEPSLLAKKDAERGYRDDHAQFAALVRTALGHQRPGAGVGATLPDGGELLRDIATMLGQKKYFELVDAVYGSRGSGS